MPMKTRLLFLLAFVVCSVNGLAQNLVPNGSFEEGEPCPTLFGGIEMDFADW
jgi:hypothetical protein